MKKILIILLLIISSNLLAQEELSYDFKNEMYSKSLKELRIIRNEFFAKKGYIFKSKDLNKHFSQFSWYEGTKSIEQIELSEIEKLKTDFIKNVEHKKKLNSKRIKTLELLSILPEDSMGSWDWAIEDRIEYTKDCKNAGYLLNDNSGMMQKSFIDDQHLFVQVIDGCWEFLIIDLSENKSFILTNDMVGGGNGLIAYISNGGEIKRIKSKILPENWWEYFKPKNKNCELPCSPFLFDFDINNDIIKIKSWKDYCLLKRELTLKLNKDKLQYEIQK